MKLHKAGLDSRVVTSACVGFVFAVAGQCAAVDYWFWNGKGKDNLFSNLANWNCYTTDVGNWTPTSFPTAGMDSKVIFGIQSCEGQTLTNDFPRGPYHKISVSQGNVCFKLVGDEMELTYGVENSATNNLQPSVHTIAMPVKIVGYGVGGQVPMKACDGTTIVYEGPISVAPDDSVTAPYLYFNNPGTQIFKGGISAPAGCYAGGNYNTSKTTFRDGTFCFFSDVDLPNFYAAGNAHLIISNATLTTGNTNVYTYVHTCTFDILDGGRLVSGKAQALFGQGRYNNCPVVNVRDGGYLCNNSNRITFGDDGFCTLNVFPGARVDLSIYSNFSCGGTTELNVYGGVVDVTPHSVDGLRIGQSKAKNSGLAAPDRINLMGGELRTSCFRSYYYDFKDGTPSQFYVDFDGGTVVAQRSVGAFFINEGLSRSEFFTARSRAGGFRFDTHGFDVTWGPLPIQDNEGAADGGFVKLGAGKFTLDAACTYTGTNLVEQGTLAIAAANASRCLVVRSGAAASIADASYFSNAVELAPDASLSFGGSTLSLSELSAAGRVRLALAADDAGQRIAVSALSLGADGCAFELVDSSGADWSANGTYTLLMQSGLAPSVASAVHVANPVAGKSYSFAVDGDALKVTVADGESPAWVVTESQTFSDALVVDGTKFIRIALGQTLTLAGGVSGGEGARIVVAGPGALAVSCACSVPVVAVDGAIVSVSASSNLSAPLTLGADATLLASDDATLSCAIEATAGAKASAASGKTLTLAGDVSGALTSSGAGAVCFTGDATGAIVLAGETVFDAMPSSQIAFDGGTFIYAGAADATLPACSVLREDDPGMGVRLAEGAGDLTISNPIGLFGSLYSWFRTAADNEIVFSGTPLEFSGVVGNGCFRMGCGNFRFASDFSLIMTTSFDAYNFSLGEGGNVHDEEFPARATVEDGASVAVANFALAPEEHGAANADAEFTQNGGKVSVASNFRFGPGNRASNVAKYEMNGGEFSARTTSFRSGDTVLSVNGGEMTFGTFANGVWGNVLDGYVDDSLTRGHEELVDVSGGRLAVADGFSWLSAVDLMRQLKVKVEGDGVLELPATFRDWDIRDEKPNWATTLFLDGGLLRLGAAGTNGSAADALAGLDDFVFGTNGANVEVAEDVTVTQPLRGVTSVGGDVVKSGAGTLTLAANDNRVWGAVEVKEGTLAARFDTAPQKGYPNGLAALWDFDGDEPLKDKTGHGFDLIQMHEATGKLVSFTEGDAENGLAHSGKSAYWPTWGGSLGMTNNVAWPWRAHTVSFWVRMKSFDRVNGLISFFSTRSTADGYRGNTWCVCLKGSGENLHFDGDPNCYGGICAEDTLEKFTLGEWHMVTTVRDGLVDREYIDGQSVECSPGQGAIKAYAAYFKEANNYFTIGQTYGGFEKGGEYINDGAMMDDVAVFSRALSAEEIAAMYAESARAPAPAVKVAAGATFDMAGGSLATPLLAGAGTVANGTLAVTGRVAMAESGAIHVATPAFPSRNVVVDFGRDSSDPLEVGRYAVIGFDSLDSESAANVVGWKAIGTGRARRFASRFSVDAAANAVVMELAPPGLTLIVR